MFIYLAIPLTLAIFFACKHLQSVRPYALFNPVLLSIVFLVLMHYAFALDYAEYEQGTYWLSALLEPAVVTLALPLYLQLNQLKGKLKNIFLACMLSVVIAFSGAFFLLPFLGADLITSASLAAQSVTTPIAMNISTTIEGIPSLTAAMVLFVGVMGASIGLPFLEKIGVKDKQAQGVAVGCASHALGTARVLEVDQVAGAFSSLALILCAILSALLMPILYMLLF